MVYGSAEDLKYSKIEFMRFSILSEKISDKLNSVMLYYAALFVMLPSSVITLVYIYILIQ